MTARAATAGAEFSAPKIAGINRHETEALRALIGRGRRRAAALYLVGVRRYLDAATGVAGDGAPMRAADLVARLARCGQGEGVSVLLGQLRQAGLVRPLAAPKGRLRLFLPLVDRLDARGPDE